MEYIKWVAAFLLAQTSLSLFLLGDIKQSTKTIVALGLVPCVVRLLNGITTGEALMMFVANMTVMLLGIALLLQILAMIGALSDLAIGQSFSTQIDPMLHDAESILSQGLRYVLTGIFIVEGGIEYCLLSLSNSVQNAPHAQIIMRLFDIAMEPLILFLPWAVFLVLIDVVVAILARYVKLSAPGGSALVMKGGAVCYFFSHLI